MWTRIDRPFAVPTEVRSVLSRLYDAGHEAYLVGGCVRDFIRQTNVKDYDIASSAKPDEVQKIFPKVISVGKAFGVMKVVTETGAELEVATFRKESGYQDHRHPQKIEFSDVKTDSERRDFTINALYFDLKTSQILDFHGGLEDLSQKKIKAIGNPKDRFKEDALRLMRAIRFAARFGFQIEANTSLAIKKAAPLILKVSIERVRDELEKMLTHVSCKQAFQDLDDHGLLENILPEIAVARLGQKKVWEQTLRVLSGLSAYTKTEPLAFFWALIYLPTLRLLPIDKRDGEARVIAKRLKLSHEALELFAYLVQETPKFRDVFSMREATLLRWMRVPSFEVLMRFHELDAIAFDGNQAGLEFVRSIYADSKKRFAMKPLITGEDLVKLGMLPGRQFSEILTVIEDLFLEGSLSSSDAALDYVLKHYVK